MQSPAMKLFASVILLFVFGLGSAPAGTMRLAQASAAPSAAAANPQTFRDCADCPEMVPLTPGKFMMGASARERKSVKYVEWALPQHEVTIAYPFAVGRYEVTVDEFGAYAKATGAKVGGICGIRLMETGKLALKYEGTPHPGNNAGENGPYYLYITDGSYAQPGLPVTGKQPAVCVSRNEMKAYLAWLSAKTGHRYRLLTDAEWEYAYRAGTDTINFWGDDFRKACAYANFGDRKSGYQAAMMAPCAEKIHPAWTAEIGSYLPNPWGLYDMAGNVQEAVEDCFHKSFDGAPADGSPWMDPGCLIFVARGGDYELTQFSMRASERLLFGYAPDDKGDVQGKDAAFNGRSNVVGFRVAMSLDDTAWDRQA